MSWLIGAVTLFAVVPFCLYFLNTLLYRAPPQYSRTEPLPSVSVLIPARNEEATIARCIHSICASTDIHFEIIVLNDHSTDRTLTIVNELIARDTRIRCASSQSLPQAWCGKQFACHQLAQLANHSYLAFIDADIVLESHALSRMVASQQTSGAELISGFPRQITVTFLERLVLPLINWLLLAYLPICFMRRSRHPAFGAGCGQFFLTTREAYLIAGGHAAIRASFHDGLALPRAYRRCGLRTDICDLTELASCRMYHSSAGVWFGLAKNAHEGMGSSKGIVFWSFLLIGGHILPWLLLILSFRSGIMAVLVSLLPRIHATYRFHQSWWGALLHAPGIGMLLLIQWYSLYRRLIRKPILWKDRAPSITHASSK